MQIDEGGVLSGSSLSDYVSGRVNDIARQRAEVRDSVMEVYLQRTSLLRAHLVGLAKPLDELLAQFRVRGLLEEVQSKYWKDSKIETFEPDVYREFVLKPNPNLKYVVSGLNTGEPERRMVGVPLDHLLANFQRLIPGLREYGITLVRQVRIRKPELRWRATDHGSYEWHGPGAGGHSTPSHYGWVRTGQMVNVSDTRTMRIAVEKSQDGDSYDLWYSYRGEESASPFIDNPRDPDLRGGKLYLATGFFTPVTRISANDSPDILMKLIGDDAAADLAG